MNWSSSDRCAVTPQSHMVGIIFLLLWVWQATFITFEMHPSANLKLSSTRILKSQRKRAFKCLIILILRISTQWSSQINQPDIDLISLTDFFLYLMANLRKTSLLWWHVSDRATQDIWTLLTPCCWGNTVWSGTEIYLMCTCVCTTVCVCLNNAQVMARMQKMLSTMFEMLSRKTSLSEYLENCIVQHVWTLNILACITMHSRLNYINYYPTV